MGDVLRSKDDQISLVQTYGAFNLSAMIPMRSSSTNATATSGFFSIARPDESITLPALGSGVTGMYCSRVDLVTTQVGLWAMLAAETNLGSINMNTGTFTDGVAMPTRTVKNSTVTSTVAQMVVAYVSTAYTATTPTVTITYTNQDGVGSRTATLVLPTNALRRSCFLVYPHLQSGDTGIRDITNVTKSAGTAGVIQFYGLHVLNMSPAFSSSHTIQPETIGVVPWILSGSEQLGIYTANGSQSIFAHAVFLPDN